MCDLSKASSRRACLVDRHRAGTGGVHPEADHVGGIVAFENFGDRRVESADVVGRVLPGQIRVSTIQQHSRIAGGIVVDAGGQLGAGFDVHEQCPHAIGAVIQANRKFCH